ncbi:MAG TPA: tetratricopeptide repeat protein [Polyangia bacterium]|nr:tetratricopeptide repeat protein [Polyangia bacterium]
MNDHSKSHRRDLLIAGLLVTVTMAVFWRVLGNGFVQWDDDIMVYKNPHIQGLDAERLLWMFTDVAYSMRYKPLTWLTYAVIHSLHGFAPFAFHLVAVLFHCANTILIFAVLKQLAQARLRPRETPTPTWRVSLAAGLAALAWAVHPLRVEAVARVTDLSYCQSLFFLLISLLCHLRAVGAGRACTAPKRWGVAAALSYALAMFTYPFVAGYVVVLVVLDFWPLHRLSLGKDGLWGSAARRVWREKLPFLLLSSIAVVTLIGRLNPTGMWTRQAHYHPGAFAMAMQAGYVWTYYLWKPWWPLDLSPVYTALFWFVPTAWPFWVSAALVIGLTVSCVLWRRRWPLLLALWICHLVLLVPALGLTESPHYTSDRHDYIPAILWSALLLAGLCRLSARSKAYGVAVTALVAVIVAQSAMTIRQTRVWHDSETLFRHTIASLGDDPYRAIMYQRLGIVYAEAGSLEQAIEQYRLSLAINPSSTARQLLAESLEAQGKFKPALFYYGEQVRRQPENAQLHGKMGFLLARVGRFREAVVQLREALRLQPNSVADLDLLALILVSDSDATLRDGPTAVRLAERACELTGHQQAGPLVTLAAAYLQTGRYAEAETEANRAFLLLRGAADQTLTERIQEILNYLQRAQPAPTTLQTKGEAPEHGVPAN